MITHGINKLFFIVLFGGGAENALFVLFVFAVGPALNMHYTVYSPQEKHVIEAGLIQKRCLLFRRRLTIIVILFI